MTTKAKAEEILKKRLAPEMTWGAYEAWASRNGYTDFINDALSAMEEMYLLGQQQKDGGFVASHSSTKSNSDEHLAEPGTFFLCKAHFNKWLRELTTGETELIIDMLSEFAAIRMQSIPAPVKEVADRDALGETRESLSELIRSLSRIINGNNGVTDFDKERLERAKKTLSKYYEGGAEIVRSADSREGECQKCGGHNPVWSAENELWNTVVGSEAGILCPVCFDKMAREKGFNPYLRITKEIPTNKITGDGGMMEELNCIHGVVRTPDFDKGFKWGWISRETAALTKEAEGSKAETMTVKDAEARCVELMIGYSKKQAVAFAEWKDKYFRFTYEHRGKGYTLRYHEHIEMVKGSLYGEHYNVAELYQLFLNQ